MHYYQFNIGDYAKATRHLSNLEDLAYRRLMELYYDTEKPLIMDIKKLARLINMRENQEEIETVLEDFFFESEGVYVQNRIEEELINYKLKATVARANGQKGGRPKKPNNNPVGFQKEPNPNPEETGSKANHKPITNNQELETNNKVKKTPPINSYSEDPKKVFDFWALTMDKPRAKFTDERKKKVEARLKEGYTFEQIKESIIGCLKDPFSQGANDRNTKYDDLELICRSGKKLESYFSEQKSKVIQTNNSNYKSLDQLIQESEQNQNFDIEITAAEENGREPKKLN